MAAAQRSQLQTPRPAQSDWEAIVNEPTQVSAARSCQTPRPQAQLKAQQAPRVEPLAEGRAGSGVQESPSNHAFVAHGLMDIFASQVDCRESRRLETTS